MGLSEAEQAAMKEEGAADLAAAERHFECAEYTEAEAKASRAHQLLPFAEGPIVVLLQLHQRGSSSTPIRCPN